MKKVHRGVSFGTVFMLAVTIVVTGLSASILPRLLGTADLHMDTAALSALTLDGAIPALTLSDIPINNAMSEPSVTPEPSDSATQAPTPVPTPTPFPGGTVTLTLGGSINIDDAVRKSAYYSESKKYDFTEILALLEDEMSSNLTMLTLENITSDAHQVSALNAPPVVFDMLAQSGVDIVALGYPKAADKGLDGLRTTVAEAQERGLVTLGTYNSETDAATLRLFTIDGVKVAFLHFAESVTAAGKKAISGERAEYALATTHISGSEAAMLADIREARAAADVVVVSLNWGKVSAAKPTTAQQDLAQQIADAGADVIVGAGTRVVQPVTWLTSKDASGSIRQTLCAWNLGSLLNESRKDGNVLGMLLQLQVFFDGKSISFEKVCYTPTYIWRYKQDGQYQYRIVPSDQPAPDGMGDDQIGYMQKAYKNIQKYLGDSPVTLREK